MEPTTKIRFESFSDGVFAIAITLLALELHVPALNTDSFRAADLIPLIPGVMTFVLSFVAIAIFWVNHHQLTQVFTHITRRRILWLNIFFLLFLTLIPFVTETMSANIFFGPSISIYAIVLFGASASFSWLRYWIHRSNGDRHILMGRSIIGPAIYFLAVLAPLVSIELAYILLAIPPLFYFLPKHSTPAL
ncbi:MAG: TMEM175 family protein [Patescibacteria group bacterium]